jgi:hypothetical protein
VFTKVNIYSSFLCAQNLPLGISIMLFPGLSSPLHFSVQILYTSIIQGVYFLYQTGAITYIWSPGLQLIGSLRMVYLSTVKYIFKWLLAMVKNWHGRGHLKSVSVSSSLAAAFPSGLF